MKKILLVWLAVAVLLFSLVLPGFGADDLYWSQVGGSSESISCMINVDGLLYAGRGDGVWTWDGTTWSQLGDLAGSAGSPVWVRCLALSNGVLYAGTAGVGVWAWDGTNWSPAGGSAGQPMTDIMGLVNINGVLYAAADYSVWTWDGITWSMMSSAAAGDFGAGSGIMDLLNVNGLLYAGTFGAGLWYWNGTVWSQAGGPTGLTGSNAPYIECLASVNDTVYAGTSGAGVWAWDGLKWSQVGCPTNYMGDEAFVNGLANINGVLYVAAMQYGGSGADVWTWDGQKWSAVGEDFGLPSYDLGYVRSIVNVNGVVYLGTDDGLWGRLADRKPVVTITDIAGD